MSVGHEMPAAPRAQHGPCSAREKQNVNKKYTTGTRTLSQLACGTAVRTLYVSYIAL